MKKRDYIAFVFVSFALMVSIDMVLNYSGHNLMSNLTGYHFELVKSDDKYSAASDSSIDEQVEVEYALPEDSVGSGEFDIASPSGSTVDGKAVVLYKDSKTIGMQVGISARGLDNSLLTYFYIDGIEVNSQVVGVGYDGSLNIPDSKSNVGSHKVHAIQYKDNDKKKGLVFNRMHEFEIRNK